MDSGQTLFLVANDMAASFRTKAYLFTGFFHFGHIDNPLIRTGSQEGSFIQKVTQIGTGKARRLLGNRFQINILA